ncbi:MAG: transposase [Candidatus Parvibacillus calidus]|nr:MAG: transposase [Candidatus Parvibacillus calidus]
MHQAIGRIQQKYPSVSKYYKIGVQTDTNGNVTSIDYRKDTQLHAQEQSEQGVYFLRTNMDVEEERIVWEIYNIIREIESTFRCLKTDLDLRPIYHKRDDATMAHLHLGILAYTVVNTVRQRLKVSGINHSWTEILRIARTQKMVTTRGTNMTDQLIEVRKSSVPTQDFQRILDVMGYKKYPFVKNL